MSASCGFRPRRPSNEPCEISYEVNNRSGKPRWWCYTHGCAAWDAQGKPVTACLGAGVTGPAPERTLTLDPGQYRGGVALWGAVDPVYNTGPEPRDCGVHVHARELAGGDKVVDRTYDEVVVEVDGRRYVVDAPSATSFVAASVFGLRLKALACPHCGDVHLDADEFAVHPHRKHQCNQCGRQFFDAEPSISNPCVELRRGLGYNGGHVVPSSRSLSVNQSDVRGLAIWGSNPAIVWTSDTPEQSGIHVHHTWDTTGAVLIDETYGFVTIDKVALHADQVRALMVQRSLPHLEGRIVSLCCPVCQREHFDRGIAALVPRATHTCEACGNEFGSRTGKRKVVANPILTRLEAIERRRPPGRRSEAA
jgi:predicted RNA-binding Zn-ribbon protein involved in translation (DUF1610 family)